MPLHSKEVASARVRKLKGKLKGISTVANTICANHPEQALTLASCESPRACRRLMGSTGLEF